MRSKAFGLISWCVNHLGAPAFRRVSLHLYPFVKASTVKAIQAPSAGYEIHLCEKSAEPDFYLSGGVLTTLCTRHIFPERIGSGNTAAYVNSRAYVKEHLFLVILYNSGCICQLSVMIDFN